ncbi:MAG TPA: LPS export ABC transporter periplasmic protein LptC, partial [Candidatus Bathyarchaeia archaeon]|nr:LPS export ABC transporter periplasmic protein LptC [Candidatus Bathyarchaeia archaeon]
MPRVIRLACWMYRICCGQGCFNGSTRFACSPLLPAGRQGWGAEFKRMEKQERSSGSGQNGDEEITMRQKILCGILEVVCLLLCLGLASANAQDMAQQVNGFTLEGFDETGERAWEVNGDTANIDGNTITISNVDANAYGEQDVNLKAKQGEINKESGDVHLQQDVVITTADGSQLKTDSLRWEKETNEVSTTDPAQIIDKGMTATGIGLKAN